MICMPSRQRSALDAARGRPISLATFTFVATLLGCASTSQTAVPRVVPAGSSQSSPGEAELRGASERAVRAPVLERAAFVRAVLESNPTLEAARHGIGAAIARVRQSGAFEDPMLELGVAPLSIASSGTPFGFEVGASQKLPWFGKRGLETEAAQAEADAARSDYEAMKRELGLTAVALYDDYFLAARSLDINAEHVVLMRAVHESAVLQFASGRGSTVDALMAEAELTHMEHDAMILATERAVTTAQMNELLHRAPELPLPPPPKELALPGELDPSTRDASAAAVAKRPDIAASEERARAQEARAERAERDSYPDITLSTSYNSMWDMPQHRWMVGVGFNVPIQTERRSGAADEARALRAQFASEAARLTDVARTQAFVAQKQLEESKHVLELFERRLLPVAREEIDATRAAFVTAKSPINAVIEAERNLRALELEYQRKRAEYARRRAELDRAFGRIPGLDWQEEQP